jgi:hypothetical protein
MERFTWDSEAFINVVFRLLPDDEATYKQLQEQLMEMHFAQGREGSAEFHKKRLGKQAFCWNGSQRFWVWEDVGAKWRVFANNGHGTSFETREGLTTDEALEAFQGYRRKVGLAT